MEGLNEKFVEETKELIENETTDSYTDGNTPAKIKSQEYMFDQDEIELYKKLHQLSSKSLVK
jgi:hypothetical protein